MEAVLKNSIVLIKLIFVLKGNFELYLRTIRQIYKSYFEVEFLPKKVEILLRGLEFLLK
jgi:hypothetical protein